MVGQDLSVRKVTYVDRDLDDRIQAVADQQDMSESEIIREGLRRQLSVLETEDNNE
jgi:predicted transcriptional regulator